MEISSILMTAVLLGGVSALTENDLAWDWPVLSAGEYAVVGNKDTNVKFLIYSTNEDETYVTATAILSKTFPAVSSGSAFRLSQELNPMCEASKMSTKFKKGTLLVMCFWKKD